MMNRPRTPHAIPIAAVLVAAAALAPRAQSTPAARVTKIAGDKHHLALMSDGRVIGWGQFRSGQLGPYDKINAPGLYSLAPIPQELSGKAVDVAASDSTSYVLFEDGSVWAWGRGDYGQLGLGAIPPLPLLPSPDPAFQYRGADRPRRVPLPPAVAVAASGGAAYAVLRDGSVRVWGNIRLSNSPKEGFTNGPVPVAGAADVASISAGQTHTLVVTKDGRVYGWGSNSSGELGREWTAETWIDRAVAIEGLTDVVTAAAAMNTSTALKKDGAVVVWGTNRDGLFGNGIHTSHPTQGARVTPEPVPGIANVTALASAGRHTVVLLKDGTVRGWGNTDFGQLGAGVSGTYQPKPVTPKIAGVERIFAGGNNTFVVKTDGSLWGWGGGGSSDWPFKTNVKVPTAVELK